MTTPTPSPRTAAGRALLDRVEFQDAEWASEIETAILAIEAEAAPAGGLRCDCGADRYHDTHLSTCPKALAASQSAAPLEREKLARALHEGGVDCNPLLPMDGRLDSGDPQRHMNLHREAAAAIAAAIQEAT